MTARRQLVRDIPTEIDFNLDDLERVVTKVARDLGIEPHFGSGKEDGSQPLMNVSRSGGTIEVMDPVFRYQLDVDADSVYAHLGKHSAKREA